MAVDPDALNASFDRIEAGNERARKARQVPPRAPARARKQPTGGGSITPDSSTGGKASAPARASTPGTRRPPASSSSSTSSPVRYPRVVDNGAGVLLAFLAWGWVGLPFLHGGPSEVKRMLRAKFLNQAPDGTALP